MSTGDPGFEEAIPFREWMRRALFDPSSGYYSRNIRAVGRRGDFSTAASVGGALGDAVGAWLKDERRREPGVRAVIEVGGGAGHLTDAVRRSLGWLGRMGLRFFIVEGSAVLRRGASAGLRARWFDDLPAALAACDGRAFIFHNELMDAFPVTLAEWNGESWDEIWLRWRGRRWMEERRALGVGEAERSRFSALAEPVRGGPHRVELGTGALEWIEGWAAMWREGSMLTIDYGDEFPALYERRPRGTLRGYVAHQVVEGAAVYANMGRQDVTADVNFTDLIRWGERHGWWTAWHGAQRDFLRAHLRGWERRLERDAALRFLADEHGAGTAFKALVQRVAKSA